MTEETKKEKKVVMPEPNVDLSALLKKVEALEKDRDMLLQVADKKQLGVYYQRHQAKIPNKVMLRVMDVDEGKGEERKRTEKVIMGWRTTKDEVYQDPATMRWIEKQNVELLYEDGTSQEMYLRDFNRLYRQVPAEVKQKISNEQTGDMALEVMRLDNGKTYKIGISFIN